MATSGYLTLYAVNYWAWDGSSREIHLNGDVVESLLTAFIYAFWEDEDLITNFEEITGIKWDKVESTRRATDEEEAAFEWGWISRQNDINHSYGNLE